VGNLDDILQVAGADVLHVAASDLGQSMGNPGVAEVRRVMSEVIPRVRAGGKFVGVGGNNPADTAGVAEFVNLGANFVTVSAWGLLRIGGEDFLKRVHDAL
jgi:2-keto-3-deoxy-L-rhamnonate aldolase RhmA